MRVSRRVWSGGTGKHGGKQAGVVTVYDPGEVPPPPRSGPAMVDGRVVLVCGGKRAGHRWLPATAPAGGPPGPWLQCAGCGFWARPDGYRP
jgi:hypothetical protein